MHAISTMEKYELIKQGNGFHGPHVYRDSAGRIRVGNKHGGAALETIATALAYAKRALLRGDELARARAQHEAGADDEEALAYQVHVDAELQIDAINRLS